MLISTYQERQTRNREKIKQLLNFLKEETYSDFKTLILLFGFRDHKSLYTLLSKVERMGLIQKHVLVSRTIKISLWGITSDGLAVVLTPDDALSPHDLSLQRLPAGRWNITLIIRRHGSSLSKKARPAG